MLQTAINLKQLIEVIKHFGIKSKNIVVVNVSTLQFTIRWITDKIIILNEQRISCVCHFYILQNHPY